MAGSEWQRTGGNTLKQQRLDHTHSFMRDRGLDVLVVGSTDSIQHRGNVRYLTNYSSRYGPSLAVVAARDEPVLVVPAGSFQLGWARRMAWVSDIRAVSDFATAAAELIQPPGERATTVGLAGLENLAGSLESRIMSALPTVHFVQVGDPFRLMRSAKLPDEQVMSTQSVRIADAALSDVSSAIGAGVTERKLFASASQRALLEGAEDVFLLISSGPDNVVMPGPADRVLQAHDVVRCSVEPAAPGGMWTQTIRMAAVGGVPANVRAAHALCVRALERVGEMMKPGVTGGQLAGDAIEILQQAAGGEIGPLGHGMGLDLVEPPLMRLDDETILQPGMVIAVHPHLTWNGAGIWIGDTFLVTEGGAERLSAVPIDLAVL
jgi:Xaa-Pro dipeptidase